MGGSFLIKISLDCAPVREVAFDKFTLGCTQLEEVAFGEVSLPCVGLDRTFLSEDLHRPELPALP